MKQINIDDELLDKLIIEDLKTQYSFILEDYGYSSTLAMSFREIIKYYMSPSEYKEWINE